MSNFIVQYAEADAAKSAGQAISKEKSGEAWVQIREVALRKRPYGRGSFEESLEFYENGFRNEYPEEKLPGAYTVAKSILGVAIERGSEFDDQTGASELQARNNGMLAMEKAKKAGVEVPEDASTELQKCLGTCTRLAKQWSNLDNDDKSVISDFLTNMMED